MQRDIIPLLLIIAGFLIVVLIICTKNDGRQQRSPYTGGDTSTISGKKCHPSCNVPIQSCTNGKVTSQNIKLSCPQETPMACPLGGALGECCGDVNLVTQWECENTKKCDPVSKCQTDVANSINGGKICGNKCSDDASMLTERQQDRSYSNVQYTLPVQKCVDNEVQTTTIQFQCPSDKPYASSISSKTCCAGSGYITGWRCTSQPYPDPEICLDGSSKNN